MKRIVAVILTFICCNFLMADQIIRLVEIDLPDHNEVYKLRRFDITIIDAGKNFAIAQVNDKQIADLRRAGYQTKIIIEDYQAYKDAIFQRGFYHTYDQVYAVLDSFANDYPNICRLDTIGYSIQNRPIWAMRVTDNPQIEENESEIRLAGNMHGDEHIGTEITLYFLRYLLTNYATNSQVQSLIDNREIWVLPTLNPDGKVANTRRNTNNVDLNRDYGYFWDGWGGSPGPSSQIENKIIMQHLEENDIALEYNYHSAAQYVNYPWDYHYVDPPDSQHIINISEIYADSAALTAINGYDWYQVTGSLQDYTIGVSGALAWTIETLEPSSSSAIDQICYNNRDALMDVCERAGWGIEGVVKDSVTNTPLHARIEFMNPDRIDIYTDPNLGDFHKMIEQGNYDLRVSANGYVPKVISNVNVPTTGTISVGDIPLAPDSSFLYAFRAVLCRYANHAEQSNATKPRAALGPEDNLFFSLGQGGYIVFDMGSDSPIGNIPGEDLTVYEGNDGAAEGYEVFASNDWDGPWFSCGSATGTASFDLSSAGLNQARYIRIADDGSSSSGSYAGFDVDAVEGSPRPNTPCLFISDYEILDGNNGMLDAGETSDFVVTLQNAGILAATNTHGALRTDDVYISINDSSGFYGEILPDSEKTNTSDPFIVSASASTPYGHVANFDLIVTADDYTDTLNIDMVVGKKPYYIWNPDPTPTPGQKMDSILTDLGYSGDYGTALAPDLTLYQSVLVCLGIYPNNYIIADPSPDADALVSYLNNGGRVYMEGGEVWFFGALLSNWYDFGPLFGITPQGDGVGDMGPVVGETGTFTNGMNFAYGGENLWMDHIDTTGGSFRIFHDGDNVYYCGVANDPGDYRTVGTSFELGLLTDGTAPSTRAVLLDSIMKFFGIINPADTIPPLDPPITEVEKSGTDAILKWNQVIDDTLGDPEAMDCYVVYRNVSSDFIPSSSDSIGTVVHPDTEYTDTGALTAGQNYYYLVKAVDSARNMSSKSNMGYVYNKFVNENLAATDKNWVSLGWHSGYGSVSDLVDDLSPSGDPLVKVTNLRDDQLYESWSYTTIPTPRWTGTNFAIESGRAYEMVTTVDDTLVLVGCNEPNGLIFLNENPVGTDKNWRSLPYNAVYDFVEDITDEYASFGDPLAKITNLRDDQLYESWSYTTIPIPRWTGTNFAIEAGRGYEFVTIVDTTWNPTEYSNEPIFGEVMARKGSHTPNVEMHVGTLTEPNRASVWSVMEKSSTTPQIQPQQNRDYLNAQQYVVIEKNEKIKADYREVGISHLVRGYFKVAGLERLVFTAYRPDRPHDMLTENIVGSGYAKDDAYVLFWFDVGNFKKPWQEGDEIILVIGASQNDTWHFTDLKFKLDKHVDIQELGELAFVSVSQGSQGRSETPVPIDYAFKVLPNPFVKKTRIDYALPKETAVEMVIYDVSGRQVKTLVFEMHKPGYYSTFWNGSDDRDRKTPSGVYFIKFVAGGFRIQEKILLVR